MRRLASLVALLWVTVAFAQPGARRTARVLTPTQADRFMHDVAVRENRFYKPGVGYDGQTGMTFDGHAVDFRTGALRGGPRTFSAASKESLHLILLTKAVAGERTAQTLVADDPEHPETSRATALSILEKKIATYEKFDRDYPGYGGFLPWYRIEGGAISPTSDWGDRVPGLDNGQLAWSLYHTARTLEAEGEHALAARYERHLDKLRKNVVRIFYDPAEHKLRAEARLGSGNRTAPADNAYANNVKGYFLDDSYEGELLGHFADLMGDWSEHPDGKDAIWSEPRQRPVTKKVGKRAFTTAEGHWLSGHEPWADLVLPYREVEIARRVADNKERVRTSWSAVHGWNGLMASTHKPVKGNELDGYVSALGVPGFAKMKVIKKPIFAPYAAFSLALVDRPMFATWLSSMLKAPGMWGENGIGESYARNGDHAPVLTWDGKALPLVAWIGGIGPEVGVLLKREGLYDAFVARVRHDFSKFDGITLAGEHEPLRAPAIPRGAN